MTGKKWFTGPSSFMQWAEPTPPRAPAKPSNAVVLVRVWENGKREYAKEVKGLHYGYYDGATWVRDKKDAFVYDETETVEGGEDKQPRVDALLLHLNMREERSESYNATTRPQPYIIKEALHK